MHWRRKWQPTPVLLPGESQRQRSLVGCCLWGHTKSDTTEVTQQQQQQQQQVESLQHTHTLPSSLQEPGSFMGITSFKLNSVCTLSCSTPCYTMDGNLPGSSVHGILQARILQWVAMPFSRGSSQLRDQIRVFCVSCILPLCYLGSP